jgi:ATP-dependent 26S proteasome regulatory subunit
LPTLFTIRVAEMGTISAARDLELLIRSRHGLIVLDSDEPDRVRSMLNKVSNRLGIPLFVWSLTRGLSRDGEKPLYNTTDLGQALSHAESAGLDALYYFQGLDAFLQDRVAVAKLRDLGALFSRRDGAILTSGIGIELPPALRPFSATLEPPIPKPEEYRAILQAMVHDLVGRGRLRVEMTAAELDRMVDALTGLSLQEAERVLTRVMIEDDRLSPDDIDAVMRVKTDVLRRDGLLDYQPPDERLTDVAGLAGLKQWLGRRKAVLADRQRARQFGLPFPKGVLLVGVPGCGKSLSAKAVAAEWNLPLLKLDSASLYNKYVGETERNFRRALQTAENLAPCVLWIDEIEKAFATGSGEMDGGLSTRVLGGFLSWMQERAGDVFVVATANDVSRLPPEFVRKGRFDEIFFVDLPDTEARSEAFRIHLRRRSQERVEVDVATLAEHSAGFSGAELEQVVVSGLYTAFAENRRLTTELLLEEIRTTRPLSQTMAERIAALRDWARDRTVSAN